MPVAAPATPAQASQDCWALVPAVPGPVVRRQPHLGRPRRPQFGRQ